MSIPRPRLTGQPPPPPELCLSLSALSDSQSDAWHAVPPVTVSLKSSPGLLSAIGIGEAPIGLQGTFSRWESGAALRTFAYQGQAHIAAIQATKDLDWYAEELFARFAIIEEHGGF